MNIGTQTNSLINHLYSRMTEGAPAPEVGMPATTLSWTDRHAATVTAVREISNSKVWSFEVLVVDDLVTVVSGSTYDGSAKFSTAPNPNGYADMYRMSRKTGQWVRGYIRQTTGKFITCGGGLILGRSDHYVDPSF